MPYKVTQFESYPLLSAYLEQAAFFYSSWNIVCCILKIVGFFSAIFTCTSTWHVLQHSTKHYNIGIAWSHWCVVPRWRKSYHWPIVNELSKFLNFILLLQLSNTWRWSDEWKIKNHFLVFSIFPLYVYMSLPAITIFFINKKHTHIYIHSWKAINICTFNS